MTDKQDKADAKAEKAEAKEAAAAVEAAKPVFPPEERTDVQKLEESTAQVQGKDYHTHQAK